MRALGDQQKPIAQTVIKRCDTAEIIDGACVIAVNHHQKIFLLPVRVQLGTQILSIEGGQPPILVGLYAQLLICLYAGGHIPPLAGIGGADGGKHPVFARAGGIKQANPAKASVKNAPVSAAHIIALPPFCCDQRIFSMPARSACSLMLPCFWAAMRPAGR